MARKGVTGVTSPLDLLDGLRPEDVQAAVDATRRLEVNGGTSMNWHRLFGLLWFPFFLNSLCSLCLCGSILNNPG